MTEVNNWVKDKRPIVQCMSTRRRWQQKCSTKVQNKYLYEIVGEMLIVNETSRSLGNLN